MKTMQVAKMLAEPISADEKHWVYMIKGYRSGNISVSQIRRLRQEDAGFDEFMSHQSLMSSQSGLTCYDH